MTCSCCQSEAKVVVRQWDTDDRFRDIPFCRGHAWRYRQDGSDFELFELALT
jgi:hypothetical protein